MKKIVSLIVLIFVLSATVFLFSACNSEKSSEEEVYFTESMTEEEVIEVLKGLNSFTCVITSSGENDADNKNTVVTSQYCTNGYSFQTNGMSGFAFFEDNRYYENIVDNFKIIDYNGCEVDESVFYNNVIDLFFKDKASKNEDNGLYYDITIKDGLKIENNKIFFDITMTIDFGSLKNTADGKIELNGFNRTSIVVNESYKDYKDRKATCNAFEFEENESGNYILKEMFKYLKKVSLQSEYDGKTLVEIGSGALGSGIREITIPDSVVKLGEQNREKNNPVKINYLGTKAKWESIEKETFWSSDAVTVICSDGEYTK